MRADVPPDRFAVVITAIFSQGTIFTQGFALRD
jgi:hypothetical protein